MDNAEKQKSENLVAEPVAQIKQMLETRVKDYNSILTNLKTQNDQAIAGISARLDAIAASSLDLGAKKKFISKINRYLSIILYENDDLKIKPEKARIKDLEKLSTYFSIIDDILKKVENKINDKNESKAEAKTDEQPNVTGNHGETAANVADD